MIEERINLEKCSCALCGHIKQAFKKGVPSHIQGGPKIVIYRGAEGNGSVRFQVRDGQAVTHRELLARAVQPEPRPDDRPEELKAAQMKMDAARAAHEEKKEAWFVARDELAKLLRRKAKPVDVDRAKEAISLAALERAANREALREASVAYHKQNNQWSLQKQFRQLEESRRKLEEQKAAELKKRYNLLIGWRKRLQKEGKA